jgi:hypothetical protein
LLATFSIDGTALSIAQRGGALDDRINGIAPTPEGILMGGATDIPISGACGTNNIFPERKLLLEFLDMM